MAGAELTMGSRQLLLRPPYQSRLSFAASRKPDVSEVSVAETDEHLSRLLGLLSQSVNFE